MDRFVAVHLQHNAVNARIGGPARIGLLGSGFAVHHNCCAFRDPSGYAPVPCLQESCQCRRNAAAGSNSFRLPTADSRSATPAKSSASALQQRSLPSTVSLNPALRTVTLWNPFSTVSCAGVVMTAVFAVNPYVCALRIAGDHNGGNRRRQFCGYVNALAGL